MAVLLRCIYGPELYRIYRMTNGPNPKVINFGSVLWLAQANNCRTTFLCNCSIKVNNFGSFAKTALGPPKIAQNPIEW